MSTEYLFEVTKDGIIERMKCQFMAICLFYDKNECLLQKYHIESYTTRCNSIAFKLLETNEKTLSRRVLYSSTNLDSVKTALDECLTAHIIKTLDSVEGRKLFSSFKEAYSYNDLKQTKEWHEQSR